MLNRQLRVAVLFIAAAAFAGCWPTSAIFNQHAYEQDVSLKVDALSVMDEATSPYDSCLTEVQLLRKNLQKAYEYAKGLPNNENTVQQWEILLDPKGNLLIAFLNDWKSKGKLGADYVELKRDQIAQGFDAIIGLESGKKK